MKGRIQHPRYTAAALAAKNPVLLDGEVVYESDTRKQKVGDGVTAWNNLPYEGGSSSPAVITITSGNRVENAPIKFTKQGDVIPVFIDRYALGGPTEGEGNDYTALFMCAQVDEEQGYWVANCVAYSMSDTRVMYATIESGTPANWYEIGGAPSTSSKAVIVSKLAWNGSGYLTIKVPVRTFEAQPNYIIRGYYQGPSGQFAFSCETCGVLQDGIDNALPGFVRTSTSQSYVMEVNTDWIDPTDDNNPFYGEAAFGEINILMRGYTAGVGVFFITVIEEIP